MDSNGAYTAAGVVGLVLPLFVSYLKNTGWSAQAKQFVALLASVAAALFVSIVDNGLDALDWQNVLTTFGIIFSVSQVFYQQYFGGTKVNAKLENSGVGS